MARPQYAQIIERYYDDMAEIVSTSPLSSIHLIE
jgi:hypothetical protein